MLTVSIVVHNTRPLQLLTALGCLLRSNDVGTVYVIDNSPGRQLANILPPDTRVTYRHVDNRGFGAGHNVAIREILATGAPGYHLVMNADVCWGADEDPIKTLLDYMDSHPDVALVQPKILYPDGMLQYSCRMLPTPLDLVIKRFLPRPIGTRRMERYLLAHHDHDCQLNSPYLTGSFMLFRVDALRECGLFDERFFMYPEDIDITRRLHRHWKTMYWPGTTVIHEHAAASRVNRRLLKVHIVNMIRYFNKWGWIADRERRQMNRRLLRSITPLPPGTQQPGRG